MDLHRTGRRLITVVNQSTITFFFLLAAYIVFITQRGELQQYLNLLFGGGSTPAGGQQSAALNPLPALQALNSLAPLAAAAV